MDNKQNIYAKALCSHRLSTIVLVWVCTLRVCVSSVCLSDAPTLPHVHTVALYNHSTEMETCVMYFSFYVHHQLEHFDTGVIYPLRWFIRLCSSNQSSFYFFQAFAQKFLLFITQGKLHFFQSGHILRSFRAPGCFEWTLCEFLFKRGRWLLLQLRGTRPNRHHWCRIMLNHTALLFD